MQPMSHDAAATAASGAQIIANGAAGLASGAAAAPTVTGLPPAGADEVSAQASAAFSTEGAETLARITAAQEEITRAGTAFTTVASMYTAVDDGASGTMDATE